MLNGVHPDKVIFESGAWESKEFNEIQEDASSLLIIIYELKQMMTE